MHLVTAGDEQWGDTVEQFKYKRLVSVGFGPWMGQPLATQTTTVMEVAKQNLPCTRSHLEKENQAHQPLPYLSTEKEGNISYQDLFITYFMPPSGIIE